MDISIQMASFNLILALAKDKSSDVSFGLVCVYGDPYHIYTSTIWQQVADFANVNSNLPIVCLGDMNEIMYEYEKSNANVNVNRVAQFRDLIKQSGLFDLGYNGPAYTWTNRHFSSNPLFQRLDRCLANNQWCISYPCTKVYNMLLIYNFSDHAPILLSTNGKANNVKSHFKFENWWLKEEDFQHYAKNAWQQYARNPFHHRTNKLANSLKVWCKKKKPLQEELKELEANILKSLIRPKRIYFPEHFCYCFASNLCILDATNTD
jgi:hypothetical protein